ncbi:hypothetical protein TNIN_310391 [Trichonephila inaurata madagascariensis]|uniref:Uncharacterized protein n=1 Tax=Trichonephila inaurata madagascariensis TaxID=2747483 RepID=A0A8X7CQT3_9ARAC|nr:hypothetical protein TNIN_310391 [Trichonephila inaurata madagascariensis]
MGHFYSKASIEKIYSRFILLFYWRPLNYKFLNFRRLALWNKEGGDVVSRLIAPSARHSQVGVVIFTRHELRFECSKRVIIVFTLGPHGVDLHG